MPENEIVQNTIENVNAIDKGRFINDNSLDIIFCDPPSFRNSNDKNLNNWTSENEYFKWMRIFFNICSMKLRKTGILYLIGDTEIISPLIQIIEEFGFSLQTSYYFIKDRKYKSGKKLKEMTKTVKVVDTIFVFTRDIQKKVKKLLKLKQQEYQKSAREINFSLSGNSNGGGYWSLYCGENSRNIMPSEQHWETLCEIFQIDIKYDDIQPQFKEYNGYNIWDDIKYVDDRFLAGTNRPPQVYHRLIHMNRNKPHNLTIWDPFTGYANSVNVMQKLGCKYYASEFDMKIFYKAMVNTGHSVTVKKPVISSTS